MFTIKELSIDLESADKIINLIKKHEPEIWKVLQKELKQAMNYSRCSAELKVDENDDDDWVQDVIDRETMSVEWRKENL